MINKKALFFTFVSDGTPHQFEPFKSIICPFEKKKRYQLDVMRDLVTFRNTNRVYIIDNTGSILS